MSAARRRGLENLGGIFTQLRRSEKWGRHLSSHAVFRVWEDAVGEALAKVARPVSLRGGTLRVEVSDPAWMQELHLMSGDILAKIKEALEGEDIENIRFQAGGGAAAIALFHNHPSGDPTPSPNDISSTRDLIKTGEIIGIPVIDHVVVGLPQDGRCDYYSFREHELID